MEIVNSTYAMISGYLSADYLSAHPGAAIFIAFLVAFAEALLVIGLVVPSTVVLVGVGTLVGSGHLQFWPVFLATAFGCIFGDQVSYWAGRWYGERLKLMWPLRNYPQLVERGEQYIRQHGGKSIAIGRFVPGIKAVVPGIVGMLKMNQLFFLAVNIASGIVWAAVHLMPGVLIGKSLALAGVVSERLLMVLVIMLSTLACSAWLIRLAAGSLSPYFDKLLARTSASIAASRSPFMRRIGLALRPDRPRARLLVLFVLLCAAGLILLADMVSGLIIRHAISNLDLSAQNLMSQLRSEPGDDLMIPVTMFGDDTVAYVIAFAMGLWLLWRRAWRQAAVVLGVFALAKLGNMLLKILVARPRPPTGAAYQALENFSFPSGHAVMAGVAFGMIAVLAGHSMARWSRAAVISTCSLAAMAVAFSRVYLGVHWLSDVLGGLLLALVLVTAFGAWLAAYPVPRLKPMLFMAAMTAVTLGYGTVHAQRHFADAEAFYAAPATTVELALADWQGSGWSKLPARRIDLAGTPEEQFTAQWAGSLSALEAYGKSQNWTILPAWRWKDGLAYLDDRASLDHLPPRPLLHEGLPARFTAIVPDAQENQTRLVLRAYQTNMKVRAPSGILAIYLISLTREQLQTKALLFAVPMRVQPSTENLPDAFAKLSANLPGSIMTRPDANLALLLPAGG